MKKTITLILFSALIAAGCGNGSQETPTKEELYSALEQLVPGLLKVESVDLKKTGQEGNTITYDASGKMAFTQTLYKEVTYLLGKVVVTPQIKKGQTILFSASMKTVGSADTGRQITLSDVMMNTEFDDLLSEELVESDQRYLKTNGSSFKEEIKQIENRVAESESRVKEARGAIERFPAFRQELADEIQILLREKSEALQHEQAKFDSWYKVYTSSNDRRQIHQEMSRQSRAQYDQLNNGETAQEIKRLQNIRSQVSRGAKMQDEKGSLLTTQSLDVQIKTLRAKFDEEKKQVSAQQKAQTDAALSGYDDPLNEKKQELQAAIQNLNDKYDNQISEKRTAINLAEGILNDQKRLAMAIQRDKEVFDNGMAKLKAEGFL